MARRPVAPRAPSRTRGLVVGGRWDLVLLSVSDLSLPDLCRRGVLRRRVFRAVHLVLLRLPAGLLPLRAELRLSVAGDTGPAALLSRGRRLRSPVRQSR